MTFNVSVNREELTYEMLILEPRASDDETPESEASIGTADSSENITMDTEGATSDPSGACQCLCSCFIPCLLWLTADNDVIQRSYINAAISHSHSTFIILIFIKVMA